MKSKGATFVGSRAAAVPAGTEYFVSLDVDAPGRD